MRNLLAIALGALIAAAAAGCGDGSSGPTVGRIEVRLETPDPAPSAASVTAQLFYELVAAKKARIDADFAGATADPTAIVAAMNPTAFARIVHVTDVQIREERAFLQNELGTTILELVNNSYTPTDGL